MTSKASSIQPSAAAISVRRCPAVIALRPRLWAIAMRRGLYQRKDCRIAELPNCRIESKTEKLAQMYADQEGASEFVRVVREGMFDIILCRHPAIRQLLNAALTSCLRVFVVNVLPPGGS